MKKALVAIIGLFGIYCFQSAKAVIYTHTLSYTPLDSTSTLTGSITFESSAGDASDFLGPHNGFVDIDTSLITAISFTYTSEDTGIPITISGNDITGLRLDFKNNGSTDFFGGASGNIKSELNVLQFSSADGAGFVLNKQGTDHTFNLQANRVGETDVDDFGLLVTAYDSPAPLPLLAFLPFFKSITRLKRKYKLNQN